MNFLRKTFPGISDKISHGAKFHGSSCLIFFSGVKYLLKQKVAMEKDDWDWTIQHWSKGPLQYKFPSNKAKIFTYLQSWLAYWNGYKLNK